MLNKGRTCSRAMLALTLAVTLSGCGAAYYGAVALVILLSPKKGTFVQTTFPDAVPTGDATSTMAMLALSAEEVTLQREDPNAAAAVTTSTGSGSSTPAGKIDVTGIEILGIDFPAGYGTSVSNRDSDTTIGAGDRIFLSINGDAAQAIDFDASDTAVVGSAVASRIQARVRTLTPKNTNVPLEAYTLFTATFDVTSSAYLFKSGSPGDVSAVVFEPAKRDGDLAASDDASKLTAARLGLGVPNGGLETTGGETLSIIILNRGTDTITAGTAINLYLSHDKALDTSDVLFDIIKTDVTINVGEARRFTRRNGGAPPVRLLRQDITPGPYYVLFEIEGSNSEKILDNNVAVSSRSLEVYDGPVSTTGDVAPATSFSSAVDFVIATTQSPIGAVTTRKFATVVTVTNLGAKVEQPTLLDFDVVLSADEQFDEPGGFTDPATVIAGVRINPTDTNQPITINVNEGSNGTISVVPAGAGTLNVTYDPSITPVSSLTEALNTQGLGLVDAFADGKGSPSTDTLKSLLTAAKSGRTVARDVFVASRRVTFAANDRPQQVQSFRIEDTLRNTSFKPNTLPAKLFPFVRMKPVLAQGVTEDNTNNIREGANFVRVYDSTRATFDATTGALLPTVNSDDFAALDAVTQRPVNTGSIRQGQQRVFSFSIPDTALLLDESQLLVILRTSGFDAHLDLLSSTGDFVVGSDDSALGRSPLIYTAVQTSSQNRVFYLIVSPALADDSDIAGGGETFELTISVNTRQATDVGIVGAVKGDNVLQQLKQRFVTSTTVAAPAATAATTAASTASKMPENDVIIPFSLLSAKGEVMFVLPQRARVRFASRPTFELGVDVIITAFVQGKVPAPVEFQAELDDTFDQIIYRPRGGDRTTSHILEPGVYTFAFNVQDGVPDLQNLRLEVETDFIPDATIDTNTSQSSALKK